MTILSSNILLEIATESGLDAKTSHLLRRRLEEALEETALGVLAEFDIENQFARAVSVEPIESRDDEEPL